MTRYNTQKRLPADGATLVGLCLACLPLALGACSSEEGEGMDSAMTLPAQPEPPTSTSAPAASENTVGGAPTMPPAAGAGGIMGGGPAGTSGSGGGPAMEPSSSPVAGSPSGSVEPPASQGGAPPLNPPPVVGGGGASPIQAGGAGAMGGGPTAGASGELQMPPVEGTVTANGNEVTLEAGPLRMVVDGDFGGRIIEFSLAGTNVLVSAGGTVGSTFWPAPQNRWGWPPSATIDSEAYTASVSADGTEAELTSGADGATGIVVTKRFAFTPSGRAIAVTYEMAATGADVMWAPWEISRVPGGISFYKALGLPVLDCLVGVDSSLEHAWYEFPGTGSQREGCPVPKINQDGAGWLANASGGLLMVKTFEDIAPAQFADEEGEIEIYAGDGYVEVESQGPIGTVTAAGVAWTVTWHLLEIPAAVEVAVGSQGLLDLAATVIP